MLKNLFSLVLVYLFLCLPLQAAFILIDDFESYTANSSLAGQGTWTNGTGSSQASAFTVVDQSGNNVVRYNVSPSNNSIVYRDSALATPENTTTTTFFRMQLPSFTNADGLQSANNLALRNASLNGDGYNVPP